MKNSAVLNVPPTAIMIAKRATKDSRLSIITPTETLSGKTAFGR
jgi:hypothetical protein